MKEKWKVGIDVGGECSCHGQKTGCLKNVDPEVEGYRKRAEGAL